MDPGPAPLAAAGGEPRFLRHAQGPVPAGGAGVGAGATYVVGGRLGKCSAETGRKRLLWTGIGVKKQAYILSFVTHSIF